MDDIRMQALPSASLPQDLEFYTNKTTNQRVARFFLLEIE